MKINFTNNQLESYKIKTFPSDNEYYMKNIIIKNVGKKTSIEFLLHIKDNLENLKIFQNNEAKKFLKLKIFEIIDERMLSEINSTKVKNIDSLLAKYSASSIKINPSHEFIGNKQNIEEHEKEEDNIILSYKKNLDLSRENINFISLGMYFYIDIKELAKENKISPLSIKEDMLFTKVKIIPLVSSNSRTLDNSTVQDLRTIKKIFEENDFLRHINDKLEQNLKQVKNLSNKNRKIKDDKFFSNIFISKDVFNNINFLFSIDYINLIKNNSLYKKIINNTAFPEDIYQKSFISSLKITRKRIKKNHKNNKYYEVPEASIEQVINTSSNIFNKKINKINNNESFIEEIGLDPRFRTFHVSDKNILNKKNGYDKNAYYKYGINLTILDGYTEYLKNIKRKISQNMVFLKWYYNDTQNFVKLTNNSTLNIKKGFYNTLTNNFNSYFIDTVFPIKHQKNLNKVLTDLIGTLDIFGFFNKNYNPFPEDSFKYASIKFDERLNKENLLNSFKSLLNPKTATADSIMYFIKTYEKILLYFEAMVKNNNNSKYELEYWFQNDYVNLDDSKGSGYDYFSVVKNSGLTVIGESFYKQKILKNNFTYGNNNFVNSNTFSSLAPSVIKISNKNFYLLDFYDRYINQDYSKLEIDIKRYLTNRSLRDEPIREDLDINNRNILKNKLIKNSKFLLKDYSIVIDDVKYSPSAQKNIFKFGQEFIEEIEPTDPSLLLLQISKFIDLEKNNFVKNKKEKKLNFPFFTQASYPYQIDYLLKKTDRFFSSSSNFLKNCEEHSKFLLLYNTIHMVQICEMTKNIKNQQWSTLTKEKFNTLDRSRNYLCRLVPFQSDFLGINEFRDIKLPIYDKYFIINRSIINSARAIDLSTSYLPSKAFVKKITPIIKPFIYPIKPTNSVKFNTGLTYNFSSFMKKSNIINVKPTINTNLFKETSPVIDLRPNREFSPITHFEFQDNSKKYNNFSNIITTTKSLKSSYQQPSATNNQFVNKVSSVVTSAFRNFIGKSKK